MLLPRTPSPLSSSNEKIVEAMFSIISAELDTEAPMHAASPATWTADGDTWTAEMVTRDGRDGDTWTADGDTWTRGVGGGGAGGSIWRWERRSGGDGRRGA